MLTTTFALIKSPGKSGTTYKVLSEPGGSEYCKVFSASNREYVAMLMEHNGKKWVPLFKFGRIDLIGKGSSRHFLGGVHGRTLAMAFAPEVDLPRKLAICAMF